MGVASAGRGLSVLQQQKHPYLWWRQIWQPAGNLTSAGLCQLSPRLCNHGIKKGQRRGAALLDFCTRSRSRLRFCSATGLVFCCPVPRFACFMACADTITFGDCFFRGLCAIGRETQKHARTFLASIGHPMANSSSTHQARPAAAAAKTRSSGGKTASLRSWFSFSNSCVERCVRPTRSAWTARRINIARNLEASRVAVTKQ